jgi:hypothetical protein
LRERFGVEDPVLSIIQTRSAVECEHCLDIAVAGVFLMIVSGWVHRQQLLVIEFLEAENRLLKER